MAWIGAVIAYIEKCIGHKVHGDEGIFLGKVDRPFNTAAVSWASSAEAIVFAAQMGAQLLIVHEGIAFPYGAENGPDAMLGGCGAPEVFEVAENLLENVWKFTSRRDHPDVWVGMEHSHAEKVYFVRDNGAGFDMTLSENLFMPSRRLHTQGQFVGNGMGLSLVRRIIQKHGGRIWADSTINEGATFHFTLPESLLQ